MAKSLAELRAAKPRARQERSYIVCLAQHLVAEIGTLTEELNRLAPEDPDEGPPKRGGGAPREREIRARLKVVLDEMEDHEGELRIRAVDDGDWRRWVNAHPPREKDKPGHRRDIEVTGGYCNADDLIEDLATYAKVWNGEEMRDGDWDVLNVSSADKKRLAQLVVSMHESDLSIPKWRSALSDNLRNERASDSPKVSESPTVASTVMSLPNVTSTTPPTAP